MKIGYPIILVLAFFCVLSCSKSKEPSNISKLKKTLVNIDYEDQDYTMSLFDISEILSFTDIPKTVPYGSEKIIRYADLILKDSIIVMHSFKPYYIPFDELTWEENPENNNTWQLYFQNLFFVSVLNHAYYETKEEKYHLAAKKYISNYINKHSSKEIKSCKYSWDDATASFRTLHLLQTVANELELEDFDASFIKKSFDHISNNLFFMVDPTKYKAHNHSIMVDRSILFLAKVTSSNPDFSDKIFNLAFERSMKNFNKLIDDSGLAKEHSTTYHLFNHNLFQKVFELIGLDSLNTSSRLKVLKKNDILLQLVKPDLTFPLWGDSQMETLSPHLIERFGNDDRLQEVYDGKQLSSIVNFTNNIAVLRTKQADSGYVALFANYYSKTHKHHDDLSFIFQTLGVDILTDQGYYGYEKEHRPYLSSIYAHNTTVLNDSTYTLGKKNQYSKLTGYTKDDDVEMIKAEHNMYDSIILKRTLYYLHPNVIIVNDKTNDSVATNSLTQVYNFGELAKKSSLKNKTAQLEFPKNIIVKLTNLNPQSTILEKDSYRSRIQYTTKATKQIQFRVSGDEITSVLEVSSPKYKSPVTNVSIDGSYIYYTKKL